MRNYITEPEPQFLIYYLLLFSNAYLQVFDIAGRILKKITLTTPNDIVEINPSEIGLGTFIYVLCRRTKSGYAEKKL